MDQGGTIIDYSMKGLGYAANGFLSLETSQHAIILNVKSKQTLVRKKQGCLCVCAVCVRFIFHPIAIKLSYAVESAPAKVSKTLEAF